MADTLIKLDKIEYSTIYTLQENTAAFFYEAGMAIDADGSPMAYNADSAKGLDKLANAGSPGNWFGVMTDANGNPIVQGPSDPAPGFYISQTSLQDKTKKSTDPRRYADASSIPFIVLPSRKSFNAKLGDFCIVYNQKTRQVAGGVYADIGPRTKIGEASIAMAAALGIPSAPRNGGAGGGIVYLVFPSSNSTWPLGNDAIQTQSLQLFTNWGGLTRLTALQERM
ncbi:glycoside hydrolase family 75 protein [Deminuibacter soli]|uniref:Uncharacterized protein n=1 Tax=Deminuibacter soli TaxID=2291815 RepID=A0A3E1NG43_9BACT|nr:glycoside hydrolase family 75 protein [Deminuibacter soli]RFM26919.1 hypothetical protein DXN05_18210 [Deminuibacter soli]